MICISILVLDLSSAPISVHSCSAGHPSVRAAGVCCPDCAVTDRNDTLVVHVQDGYAGI